MLMRALAIPASVARAIDVYKRQVLDDDVEFAQGAFDVAVDEKKVGRFPRHIGSGGLGQQRTIQCRSLPGEIPVYLICGRQIEPIVGIVGIERNRGSKAVDGRLRIAGNKCEVASEPVAIDVYKRQGRSISIRPA